MATVQRGQLLAVELPTQEVDVPAVGGTVLVRGLSMPQLLAFSAARRRALQPVGDETPDQAAERASGELVPLLLAETVVLDDGLPVYSAAQWAVFGAQHPQATLELWRAAIALSGQDPTAEKKA
jgi:hypothetical protein